MNKKYSIMLTGVALTLILTGAGCKSSEINENSKDDNQIQTTATPSNGPVKEFTITAKNWQFDPGSITVNQGDKVRITITSVDVNHSFMLKDYNLNVKLEPNKTQVIEFIADKTGTFQFRCAIPCGKGHRDMIGSLIVK